MRKVVVFLMMTVDGYIAGPSGEIDWHVVDDEFQTFASDQLNAVDGLLFGRVTYEGMARYWPSPAAIENDPIVAAQMNMKPKMVFSRALEKAEWNNTRVIRDHLAEELTKLKQLPGKDLLILGSSNLSASLIDLGVLDECRIMVNPVVLGHGKSLFQAIQEQSRLKLLETRAFRSGNVLLSYQFT